MRSKLMWGMIAILMSLAIFGSAFAQETDKWHSGAYDEKRGTNFADPNGYLRAAPFQGASAGDGATAGDAGDGGAAGAAGATGGDSGGNGDGCGPR